MAGQEVSATGIHQASFPITSGTAFVVLEMPNFMMSSARLHYFHGAGSCLGRLAAGTEEAASSWALAWIPYSRDAKAFLTRHWTQTLGGLFSIAHPKTIPIPLASVQAVRGKPACRPREAL